MLDRRDFVRPWRYRMACIADCLSGFLLGWPSIGPPPQPSEVRRILMLRLDHLGDVLLTMPALRDLRARFPKSHITVLVGSWAREVLVGNPLVDRVEILDVPWFAFGAVSGRSQWRTVGRKALALRRQHFDISIDFRGGFASALLCWIIGASRRFGLGHKGGASFCTDLVPRNREIHALEQNASFVRCLGGEPAPWQPMLIVGAEDHRLARSLLAELGIHDGEPFVVFHPYSNVASKEWPLASWIELGHLGIGQNIGPIVITGPSSRRAEAEALAIALGPQGRTAAGRTSLRQLAALIERARGIVTVDSAARHVAAVMGTPTVALRHGIDDCHNFLGRYRDAERVLWHSVACSPCGQVICPMTIHACMAGITPEVVMHALKELGIPGPSRGLHPGTCEGTSHE